MKITTRQLRQIIREEVKKSFTEEEEEHRIVCHGCGHQWDLSDGGNDPYTCHECGQRATLMEDARDVGMVNGVADILTKVKDEKNRKEIAQQMMGKFDLEDVDYDKDSFLKLSKVKEAFSKGQLFAGNLKIDGQKVPVEVELIGADNKKRTFTAKVIHIDKKYYSRLPKDGILNIPAQIFRMTGGWRRIKTPSVF